MRQLISKILLIFLMLATLASCGEPSGRSAAPALSQSSSSEEQTDSDQIRTTLKVTKGGEDGKPIFTVETNMPDATELILTLQNEGYTEQKTVVVAGGSGQSDAFTDGGAPLSGKYTLTVAMDQPSQQPEEVRSVIGENGEKLVGSFMKVDQDTGAHLLSGNFKFTFDGPEAPAPEPEPEPETIPDPVENSTTQNVPASGTGNQSGTNNQTSGERPNTATSQNQGRTVYKTPTGKRYHYDSQCNGGTYIESTLEEVTRLGLTPCQKCVI